MKLFTILFFIGILPIIGSAQTGTPRNGGNPLHFQDCPGAVPVCKPVYHVADSALFGLGSGASTGEVGVNTCSQDDLDTWYTFKAASNGVVSFFIIPNDVTDTTDYAANSGASSFNFLLYKLPAGAKHTNAGCRQLPGMSNNYQVASCNTGGGEGVSGISSLYDTAQGRFTKDVIAQAGDVFLLMVNNKARTMVGYTLKFMTKANGSKFIEYAEPEPLAVESVVYDPVCQGNCTIKLTFNHPLSANNLQPYIANHAGGPDWKLPGIAVGNVNSWVDTLAYSGTFNPLDTTLRIILDQIGAVPFVSVGCSGQRTNDTLLLKPKAGYTTLTAIPNKRSSSIRVGPNPFSQTVQVQVAPSSNYRIQIFNTLGAEVFSSALLVGSQQVELPSHLHQGIYFFQIQDKEGYHTFRLQKE